MTALRPTTIAVASGKGGTGKTTVAVHLALAGARRGKTVLVDLDVEAPDALGYFPEAVRQGEPVSVTVAVPRIIQDRCTGCGLCAKACRFGAIVAIGTVVAIDTRICKGCGRCVAICPVCALVETPFPVGETAGFLAGNIAILEGRMAVGDIRSTAVIAAATARAISLASEMKAIISIRDCPPGVSCPATHAIQGADYVILVAEPTEFSLHDLDAALRLAAGCKIPTGVVINKDGFGEADVAGLCARRGVPVIGRIAFTRERAASGASAALWNEDGDFSGVMDTILRKALAVANREEES